MSTNDAQRLSQMIIFKFKMTKKILKNLVGLHRQQLINQVVEPLFLAWHSSHDKSKTLVVGPTNVAKYKMMLDLEEKTIFLRFHDADIGTKMKIDLKKPSF